MSLGTRFRPALLILALLLVIGAPPVSGARGKGALAEYVSGELVLKLFDSADLPAVAAAYGLALPPLDQFGTRPIYRLRLADGADPLAKALEIKPGPGAGDQRVEFAEPNYQAQSPEGRRGSRPWVIGGDSGAYAAQWAPAAVRLAEAHTVSRGAGVVVAVLDTGIDPDHPVFAGRLVQGFDFVDFDADPREAGRYRTDAGYGHGTHVAGIVALMAPEAKIMPLRVLDEGGVGNIWVLAEALSYAVDPDGNPATDDGAAVINLSLGTPRPTSLLEQIVREITCDDDDDDELCGANGGAVVVAAAGNSGDSTPQYPAAEAVDGLLAVAASTPANTLAAFSTRGPWVQISAPGDLILSSVPGGAYGTWSGTSMAAPGAAGAAALLRASDPGLEAEAVVDRLVDTAQLLCSEGPPRLDAALALGLSAPESRSCSAYLPLVRAAP